MTGVQTCALPIYILDGAGALGSLAQQTLENYRNAYGRWLTFLRLQEMLHPNTSPASRATPATVAAFVQELRSQVAPLTLAQRIIGLEQVVRAFTPEEDWTWLRAVARRLSNAARPVRDKRSKLRPSDELTAAGLHLMVVLPAGVEESDVFAAAARRSVRLYPLGQYAFRAHSRPPAVVMGYAGLTEREIRAGLARLADGRG